MKLACKLVVPIFCLCNNFIGFIASPQGSITMFMSGKEGY